MIRTLMSVVATTALAGCIGSSKPVYQHHYTLVGATGAAHSATLAAPSTVLRLAPVSASDWLAGTAMYYRLDYADDNRLHAYSRARWVAPPAAMLSTLLDDALAGSYRAVLAPADTADADYTLSLRVTDLEQLFASAAASDCRLAVTATLIDDRSQTVVGQRTFRYRHAAASANAAGGVDCLRGRADVFAADLKQWLAATVSAGGAPGAPD